MHVAHTEPVPLRQEADGTIRVGGSRVTLDTLIGAFRAGATAEQIVDQFSTLSLPEVYGAIAYYLNHRAEADAYLVQRERDAEALTREIEANCDTSGLRRKAKEWKQHARPGARLLGALRGTQPRPTDQDIREARQEMWERFPRETR